MSEAIARRAFETRLKTWADAQTPAIPIAWQNKTFNPPAGRYVRASMLPAPALATSLDGVCQAWRGVFQVSFYMPPNTGSGAIEALLPSLRAAFPVSFAQDTVRVFMLSQFSAAPAIELPDRYVVPCSAQYRFDTV